MLSPPLLASDFQGDHESAEKPLPLLVGLPELNILADTPEAPASCTVIADLDTNLSPTARVNALLREWDLEASFSSTSSTESNITSNEGGGGDLHVRLSSDSKESTMHDASFTDTNTASKFQAL